MKAAEFIGYDIGEDVSSGCVATWNVFNSDAIVPFYIAICIKK